MKKQKKLKVAVIQMTSTNNKKKNLADAKKLIIKAVKNKAEFILLPEVFNFRGSFVDTANQAEPIPGESTQFISSLAKKYKVAILIGSIMEKSKGKPYNTSVLIAKNGKIISKYRKIHLFDIKLKGQEILESSRNSPGEKPSLTKLFGIKIGLSICYDLRFPELYRNYTEKGAEILCIPSSFTKPTGEAHWHTLIKARAIENTCYVLAPNQAGIGSSGIKTYGHSLIVDPWGKILAEGKSSGEDIIYADLDFEYLEKIRKNLPCLKHRKL